MKPIFRSQLVWIVVTNGTSLQGSVIPFPDVPELNNTLITGIESVDSDNLTTTPDGVAVLPLLDLQLCLLTLNDGSNQRHKDLPSVQLNPTLNAGIYKELEPFPVNWQKSGVRVMGQMTVDQLSIPFVVHYALPSEVR